MTNSFALASVAARSCMLLGTISLVALPSATFSSASKLFSVSTFWLGAASFKSLMESARARCTSIMACASPCASRMRCSRTASARRMVDSFSPSATRMALRFSPSARRMLSRRSRSARICFSMAS